VFGCRALRLQRSYLCCGMRRSRGGGSGTTASTRTEVYREWLESFAPYWEESLGRLKRRVEEEKA
jgi:hypothetical protein